MKKYILLAVLILTACAPDPRRDAAAYATRIQADNAALSADQARQQQTRLDEITIREAERKQEIKDAALDKAKQSAGWVAYWGGVAVTISIVAIIISAGVGSSYALVGAGKASARFAEVKASLIYLDAKTGQFPLLLSPLGNGRYSLTDPSTNSVLMLDTRNEPDRLMVQGAMAVRHALVMSNAAAKSQDPTGVAQVQPLIIDSEVTQ